MQILSGDGIYPSECGSTYKEPDMKAKQVSRPFSEYERTAIYGVMDDLRNAIRFSDGSAGYPKRPDEATRLLRQSAAKLKALC